MHRYTIRIFRLRRQGPAREVPSLSAEHQADLPTDPSEEGQQSYGTLQKRNPGHLSIIYFDKAFDQLRQIHGVGFERFIVDKIIPVEGDMLKEELGLNASAMQMIIDNVNIIVNCAASVDFNARLDDALMINVRGPQKIFSLAQRVKNLHNFVHISTAYVNSDKQGWVEEKIYDPN